MPTIRDLYRVRQGFGCRFAIPSATIAGDDRYRGMRSEPGLGGRTLPIRQQADDPAPFQVTDVAGVSVIAPPSRIINADNPERGGRRTTTASDHVQQRFLLTGSISRFAKPAAGRPPSARPR
ncbi:hypothetical protein XH98_27245 [Bradyrhizobium sp. CCBAU 51745]|nr:hypothetical protein [Bradyrhizobium sp. CCBAU 51745]